MIPLIPLVIAGGGVLLAAALAAHAIQVIRLAYAKRRQRRREAQDAERAARAAAQQATQQRAAAQQAEVDQRRSRHPWHYLVLQRGRLAVEQSQTTERLRHRNADLAAAKAELAQATPDVPPARQLLKGVGLVFLVLAFSLSAAQLIPSFRILAGVPSGIDVLLGLIVAGIEVGVALLLAHFLRPEHGWHPLSAKVSAAVAMTFALVVVVAQVQWAPAHDTVPGRAQLAAAQETLAQDRQNGADSTIITADQQLIANVSNRLERVTERDQVLALMVTLGADISAWPAIDALQYLAAAIRRRRIRPRVVALGRDVAALEEEFAMAPVRRTYETQQVLEQLNINPDLVFAEHGFPASPEPPLHHAPPAPRAAPPVPPAAAPAPPAAPVPPSAPVATPIFPGDLFPPQPADAGPDRRWSDPL
jgi:hypothetical protein